MGEVVIEAKPALQLVDNILPFTPRERWAIFAVAAAVEAKELAECDGARNRLIIERLRKINGVMVKNVERST